MSYVGLGASYKISENFDINTNLDFRFEENHRAESSVSFGIEYKF